MELLYNNIMSKFIKIADFNEMVLGYVKSGHTYMEAVLQVCEDKGVEPEDVKSLVKGVIKDKIEAEAQGKHMLKGAPETTLSDFL